MPSILLPQMVKIPEQYQRYIYPFSKPMLRTSPSFSRIEQVTTIPGCRVCSIVNIAEKETEISHYHKNKSITLQVTLQGRISTGTSTLDKGGYNLIRINAGHHKLLLAPGVNEFMQFDISPALLQELLPDSPFIHKKGNDHPAGVSNRKLMKLIAQIRQTPVTDGIQQLKLYTQITELIITAIIPLQTSPKNMIMNNPHHELITNIQTYINDNLHKPISLSQLAGIYYISESKLKQDFKKYLNSSVQAYLQEQRMQKALKMLQHSDNDITMIATEVGYTNVSSFNREFRKHYACSPKEVRIGS
ncbi:AraC-type DNA-binding protein [Chitinophaga sp. YR573]|uniref:helix-turn-helix domain-containing protein n=1 Tax=Chitinophaga sp. YR573 TaxID=1881040 RepID=UPI0008C751A5|nr:AraC family transcriptional regulator [Chitinophaga sp. YR573]SEV92931.1 AraC-type DNA-binding protein [Chitinophaga sp. YR573]